MISRKYNYWRKPASKQQQQSSSASKDKTLLALESPAYSLDTNKCVPAIEHKARHNSANSYILEPIPEAAEESTSNTSRGHIKHYSVDAVIQHNASPRAEMQKRAASVHYLGHSTGHSTGHSSGHSSGYSTDQIAGLGAPLKAKGFQRPAVPPNLTPSPDLIQSIEAYFNDDFNLHSPPSTPETLHGQTLGAAKNVDQFPLLKSRKTFDDLHCTRSAEEIEEDAEALGELIGFDDLRDRNDLRGRISGASLRSDVTGQSLFSDQISPFSPFTPDEFRHDDTEKRHTAEDQNKPSPLIRQLTPRSWSYHFQQVSNKQFFRAEKKLLYEVLETSKLSEPFEPLEPLGLLESRLALQDKYKYTATSNICVYFFDMCGNRLR